MFTQFCHYGFIIPFARADEELDRLSWQFRLDGDRFAGLAFQATEEAANDADGVGAMFGPIEFREIALEEAGQAVRTALNGLGCEDRVIQERLSFGVIQE